MAGGSWRATLLALVLALLGCLLQPHGPHRPPPRWHVEAAVAEAPGDLNLTQLREESLEMFRFGYGQYMQRAFPRDDLRPISCRGKDSQGGIALTLIDSLDTLVVMGERDELRRAVAWLAANATFDVDARVHVFELTIRAVGGLLSAHMLIEQDPSLVPGYDGSLLRLAVDLTDRFMPAFDTPTGIPLSWVNLRRGQIPGDVRSTCTACAGTLLLEFGVLSRLTGNATYEAKARHAVETIFDMRSPRGLVGNTLSCDTGEWERTDAGVGAGVDSFYEYLLKAYLAFGDERYLHMFKEVYAAAMINLQLDPAFHGTIWLVDVDMNKGTVLHPYVWSLGAFWPGLQALAGQVEEGVALHKNWSAAWKRFGWLPEMFDLGMDNRHPTETGYPLRPELMESTFLLHTATHNPRLLATGAALHARLRNANRVACGYASVGDVSTGHLEDTMESFFLSETVKYLYLLFSNASAVVDHFVLSTEGHLLPPFPDGPAGGNQTAPGAAAGADGDASKQQQQQGTCGWEEAPSRRNPQQAGQQQGEQRSNATSGGGSSSSTSSSSSGNATSSDNVAKVVKATLEQQIEQHVEAKCRHLCSQTMATAAALSQAAATLRAAMPLLPLPAGAPALLRARRCTACKEVTRTLRRAQLGKSFLAAMSVKSRVQAAAEAVRLSNRPAYSASGQLVNRQFLCVIEEVQGGGLGCGIFKEIAARQISQHRLNALPPNFMLIQLTDAPPKQHGQGSDAAAAGDMPSPGQEPITVSMQLADGSTQQFYGALADFGPLFEPGCSEPSSSSSRRGSRCGATPSNGSSSAGGGMAGSNATSSNATTKDGVGASSRDGTAGAEAAPAHQQQSQAPQPPQPLHWRGRELAVRQGGQPGRDWRVVYVLGEEHPDGSRSGGEEEDDPYEDPEEDEEAASSSSRGRAGRGPGAAVSDGGDEYADEEEEGLGGASFAATLGLPSMLLCSVEGPAVAVQPLDACGKLANAAALNGSVAVVQRGNCMFVEKALALQAAGAVVMVVVNSEAGELMAMGTDSQGSQTAIPAVMLSGADGGMLLQQLMGSGGIGTSSGGIGTSSGGKAGGSSGSISSGDGDIATADSSRVRLRLYADALPGGPAGSEQQQCGAEAAASTAAADKSGPRRQQVELLMSQEAQLWLFKRVAETSSDPSAAFALILQQIQEHFLQQAFRKEP